MRICKDHNNKEHTHTLAEFRIPRIERSVCPAYLLETTPGTQSFSQRCWNEHFLGSFAVRSGSYTVRILQHNWLTRQLLRNLAAVILAARYLNEDGGKHRLLQTSSQPMSELFLKFSKRVEPSSVTDLEK